MGGWTASTGVEDGIADGLAIGPASPPVQAPNEVTSRPTPSARITCIVSPIPLASSRSSYRQRPAPARHPTTRSAACSCPPMGFRPAIYGIASNCRCAIPLIRWFRKQPTTVESLPSGRFSAFPGIRADTGQRPVSHRHCGVVVGHPPRVRHHCWFAAAKPTTTQQSWAQGRNNVTLARVTNAEPCESGHRWADHRRAVGVDGLVRRSHARPAPRPRLVDADRTTAGGWTQGVVRQGCWRASPRGPNRSHGVRSGRPWSGSHGREVAGSPRWWLLPKRSNRYIRPQNRGARSSPALTWLIMWGCASNQPPS